MLETIEVSFVNQNRGKESKNPMRVARANSTLAEIAEVAYPSLNLSGKEPAMGKTVERNLTNPVFQVITEERLLRLQSLTNGVPIKSISHTERMKLLSKDWNSEEEKFSIEEILAWVRRPEIMNLEE